MDIDVSMAAGWGVLFSRGTTGDIARSTITCTAEDNAVKGIWIQNGASPYIYTVDVVDCDVGILGRNNVSAAIYYHVSITGARLGVELRRGSSVNARGYTTKKLTLRPLIGRLLWTARAKWDWGETRSRLLVWRFLVTFKFYGTPT